MIVHRPNDKTYNPSPKYMAFNELQLKSGLRFSVHPFVCESLCSFIIVPTQLLPNCPHPVVKYWLGMRETFFSKISRTSTTRGRYQGKLSMTGNIFLIYWQGPATE
ncbi:hypothetical protein Fot_19671 [Forsythia ovata]|uniref:Uncharacterized protein n=1 Tax=Forsythia ovata TaxID=205694 RepID=A0ABD1VPH6_9LAMI